MSEWRVYDKAGPMELDWALAGISSSKKAGMTVGFTNGCFDILHPGHVAGLMQLRRAVDLVVVGLNSDVSIGHIKGPARPFFDEAHRAKLLCALRYVSFVFIFDEDNPLSLIQKIGPDVLAKGAEYDDTTIVGAKYVRSTGGRVLRLRMVDGVSTTRLTERIKARCMASPKML